jgi:hypothetical protein
VQLCSVTACFIPGEGGGLNNYCSLKTWRSGGVGGLDNAVLRFFSLRNDAGAHSCEEENEALVTKERRFLDKLIAIGVSKRKNTSFNYPLQKLTWKRLQRLECANTFFGPCVTTFPRKRGLHLLGVYVRRSGSSGSKNCWPA